MRARRLEVRIVDEERRVYALFVTCWIFTEAALVADMVRERLTCDAIVLDVDTGAVPYDSRTFDRRRRFIRSEAARCPDPAEASTSEAPEGC